MLSGMIRLTAPATRITVAAAFLCVLLVGFNAATSSADPDDPACWDDSEDHGLVYICETDTDGDEGSNGNNGSGVTPQCDLNRLMESEIGVEGHVSYWCEGENACWANIPSYTRPDGPADEEPPSENAVYIYKQCRDADNSSVPGLGWMWHEPPEPPLGALAELAYGRLDPPAFTLTFNPPQRSYVSIDTWWWAEGAGGEIVGTAALGVQAIGEPDHIEVNPGDGSGTFTCPWTTSESDACTYTYSKASVGGSASAGDGSPAYPAEARLVYSVRFERFGAPLELPGLPDSLVGPWTSTPVPVAEVQTRVIG